MKKHILSLFMLTLLTFSCAPDFDFDLTGAGFGGYPGNDIPSGPPAHFIVHAPDTTFEIVGDALLSDYGIVDGNGTVMHKNIESYNPMTYYYELECISADQGISLYFDFYTTSSGHALDSITLGTYYARQAICRQGDKQYQGFNYTNDSIHQQLNVAITVTHKKAGRISGSFTGKYYQPSTEAIVILTGEFKDVYVQDDVK